MTNNFLIHATRRNLVAATVLLFASAGVLTMASPASATTFCVPGYHAGCVNDGTNVALPNLEAATNTLSSDGKPDRILIGNFTYADPDTLQPTGTDQLDIVGSGTDKTVITSTGTGNQYVANLSFNQRPVDMSNLTIVIPASFPDSGGKGSAIQARGGTFDHVDIKSLNPGSDGASSLSGDLIWKNSRIYGEAGGSIGTGIANNNSNPGRLEIINTTIVDPVWGLDVSHPEVPVVVTRSRIISPVGYGVFVAQGGLFAMENSVIEGAGLEAVEVSSSTVGGETDIEASVRASTLIAEPTPDTSAIKVKITGSHNADVDVTDSIIYGYKNTWEMATPAGPAYGKGRLTFAYSDFLPVGLPAKALNVDVSKPGNITADPQLSGDLSLKPGSPAIDSGNPDPTGATEDYAGNLRPLDGNGDGSAIRDMGAFESPKVPTCKNTPGLCPAPPTDTDSLAPTIAKVKFKAAKGQKKTDTLKLTLSEVATVSATFKPVGQKGKKAKAFKITKAGKAGANTLKFGKKKLKPGKYKLMVSARDAAGNKSKTLVRKVRVK